MYLATYYRLYFKGQDCTIKRFLPSILVQCVDKILYEVVFSLYAMTNLTNMAPKRTIHVEFVTGPILSAPDACTAVLMAAWILLVTDLL